LLGDFPSFIFLCSQKLGYFYVQGRLTRVDSRFSSGDG